MRFVATTTHYNTHYVIYIGGRFCYYCFTRTEDFIGKRWGRAIFLTVVLQKLCDEEKNRIGFEPERVLRS